MRSLFFLTCSILLMRPCGEMDITTVFGTVVPSSSLGGGTRKQGGLRVLFGSSGYGLVVKRVLAKDESGVRFSLSAPISE